MTSSLPTISVAEWSMTHFLDTALNLLRSENNAVSLRLYFYAVSLSGWNHLSEDVRAWILARSNRTAIAYVGTDHALTDPDAILKMQQDGVGVRFMRHYRGIFHPKVMWFVSESTSKILAGSNNLTNDGLRNNIEFATLTSLVGADSHLAKWHEAVETASVPVDSRLIASYRREKEEFGKSRAKVGQAHTFIWSMRTSGISIDEERKKSGGLGKFVPGDLILEVMPRETSVEGRQVQIPLDAATRMFGLESQSSSTVQIDLRNASTGDVRPLTLTRNKNSTARLSIRELEYRSRPCVLLFRKRGQSTYDFEIVCKAIDPDRYANLLSVCKQKEPQRRWIIYSDISNS